QDAVAPRSRGRAVHARVAGRVRDGIGPVEVAGKKGPITVDADENPRSDTSAEALARLKPAFKTDGGTVTAGNSPGITDGAAALVIASDAAIERETAQPLARIRAYAQADVDPEWP